MAWNICFSSCDRRELYNIKHNNGHLRKAHILGCPPILRGLSWFWNVRTHHLWSKHTSLCAKNLIFCPIYRCTVEVLVLIDFEGTMGDEITVRAGDVVKNVTKASEEGWLEGELSGKRGIFPANFTKVCYHPTVHSVALSLCCVCVHIYPAC